MGVGTLHIRMMKYILSLILTLFITFNVHGNSYNVKATYYHPGNGCGWVTASGDHINDSKLKNNLIRWVALSEDMFRLYGFKIGDIIIVESEFVELCGEWVVKDKMGKTNKKGEKQNRRIDFLRHRSHKKFDTHNVKIRKK